MRLATKGKSGITQLLQRDGTRKTVRSRKKKRLFKRNNRVEADERLKSKLFLSLEKQDQRYFDQNHSRQKMVDIDFTELWKLLVDTFYRNRILQIDDSSYLVGSNEKQKEWNNSLERRVIWTEGVTSARRKIQLYEFCSCLIWEMKIIAGSCVCKHFQQWTHCTLQWQGKGVNCRIIECPKITQKKF